MLSRDELELLTVTSALGGRLTRGLVRSGALSRNDLEAMLAGAVRTTVIDGGAIGAHVVLGIEVGDALRSVMVLDVGEAAHADHAHDLVSGAGAPAANAVSVAADSLRNDSVGALTITAEAEDGIQDAVTLPHVRTWAVDDLTAEFTITAADEITNTDTNTTDMVLLVVYEDLTP